MSSRSVRGRAVSARLALASAASLLLIPLASPSATADDVPPATGAPGATGTPSPTDTPRELAEEALETVQDLVEAPSTSTPAPAAEAPDLTVALRDLALRKNDLTKADKAAAARLLARPTAKQQGQPGCADDLICYEPSEPEATPECGPTVCVHYVTTGPNATTQAYADLVRATAESVAARYQSAGYRRPVADGTEGDRPGVPSGRFDIYLGDLGQMFYGYCAPEDLVSPTSPQSAATSYCVLSTNYAQLGGSNTPTENLQVTAAHEMFHAIQFAYDVYEDGWFLEASSTWAEDEFYDGVNDNRQYLPYGPLGAPASRMDTYDSSAAPYGAWIFLRYLTERYPSEVGGLPVIVRQMWEKAGSYQYSVQAISNALRDRGTDLRTQFAAFTAWNRNPAAYYEEGAAYRPAPLRATYRVGTSTTARTVDFTLRQLSAKNFRFTPTMTGAWKFRIRVNLNSTVAGGGAVVTVKLKGKAPRASVAKVDSRGDAVYSLPFGSKVDWVEVATVNASGRYVRCGTLSPGSGATCRGTAVDDGTKQQILFRAVRG